MSEQNKEEEQRGGVALKLLPERLPRPTFWPAALSLGVTLLAFGVVTSGIISLAGAALFLVSAGGWFMELRNEQLQ
jgi:hypothetical protein